MSFGPDTLIAPAIDEPCMRQAQAQVLSLALIDARNHSLHWAERLFGGLEHCAAAPTQRQARGELLNRLASMGQRQCVWTGGVWPQGLATDWVDGSRSWAELQTGLLAGFEQLQERLMDVQPSDAALAPYQAALELEDRLGQDLIRTANSWANAWSESKSAAHAQAGDVWGQHWPAPHAPVPRSPMLLAGRSWRLGQCQTAGFVWDNERGHAVQRVAEFEIDAQPVSWAQFIEFVDDGGYDQQALWSLRGWEWLQSAQTAAQGRRAPLFVEQLGVASGAVMQRSFGRVARRAGSHAVMHVSVYEAEAFCNWADRRLPTEHEWEIAAATASAMGFRWGDVLEWTLDDHRDELYRVASTGQPERLVQPPSRSGQVHVAVRGASFAARQRNKIVNARLHARGERDDWFVGFRTCAL
jgi:gamma-glutamyl hercynylcysteine S-oxide synthase